MKNTIKTKYTFLYAALIVISIFSSLQVSAQIGLKSKIWTGTWATAPQRVEPNNMPPDPGLTNNTLRQIVRVSIGGNVIRVRLSNLFGEKPTELKMVAVALSKGGSLIDESKQKLLTFQGKHEITLQPGQEILSDALKFRLDAGMHLAITIAFGNVSPSLTGHPGSRTTSYILTGNKVLSAHTEEAVTTDHWYIINGIEVLTQTSSSSIAILGNSITDGRGSGTNMQNRWTDVLSERLLKNKKTRHIGVLNLGIGGNCVLQGGLGPCAVNRFDRDILGQSNVKWIIILEGINDIGAIQTAEGATETAQKLIGAYTNMIDKAHKKGLKVFGATILPFARSFYDKDFRQHARDIVNEWIRHSNHFDGVIDFDKIMRNPENPDTILPDMHDNDFLHPNQAGYRKMGNAIDLHLFD